MTWISLPFIKFRCAGPCGRLIERQISQRKVEQQISDLRDGPELYCAECTVKMAAYHGDVDGDGALA
jgi:hypothetical protein